ncbi:MAG: type II secretion system protein [Patescibacteria group bacterium]|nr:type II secretion system protein [Patescibacteria group bacterium]
MKIENCKLKISNSAFTLIEIMVAIAIVSILAAAVLVSMQSYGVKGRSSRALAQASSALPSMVSCWGNSGTVSDSPGDICSGKSAYGNWPTLPNGYSFSAVTGTSSSSFYFTVTGESQTICCNSAMNSCGIITGACDASATW